MKVMITMPKTASIAVDLEYGDAWEMFRDLAGRLIGDRCGILAGDPEELESKPETVHPPKSQAKHKGELKPEASVIMDDDPIPVPTEISDQEAENSYAYRGFMYVKCPECENIYGYNAKTETDSSHCRKCEHEQVFTKPLVPMFLECECGRHFRYMTNMTAFVFDVDCLECGSPVSVKYNSDKGLYETIN